MTAQPIIRVEHLTKRFDDLLAVDDLSFTVHTGEILGLLGPNGAGKTTVIQLLLGLTTPTAGAVSLFGQDVQQHRRAILQRVNFASAYVALPSNLTVRENLTVFARLYGVRKAHTKIPGLFSFRIRVAKQPQNELKGFGPRGLASPACPHDPKPFD